MVLNALQRLAQAERHISGVKQHIAQQYARIEQLQRLGKDTDLAERLLEVMERTLGCYETHRQMIEQRINKSDGDERLSRAISNLRPALT